MALAFVTREQFEIRSEVEVVHIPTGTDFRAYEKRQSELGPAWFAGREHGRIRRASPMHGIAVAVRASASRRQSAGVGDFA